MLILLSLFSRVPPSFSWVKRVCVGGETDNKTKCFVFWCCVTVQPCPRSWISKCCSWSIDMFNIMRQRKGKQEAGIKPYILLRKIHVLISWESNPGSLALRYKHRDRCATTIFGVMRWKTQRSGSRWKSNPGPLAQVPMFWSLNYAHQATNYLHNSLYVLLLDCCMAIPVSCWLNYPVL